MDKEAALLLPEWYLAAATGRPTPPEEIEAYRAAWRDCLAQLPAGGEMLLLRDYHKDNLIWLPERPGVRACGLLDFQDALRGHPSYDLVSLIEDARRDVSPALAEAMTGRYLAAAGVESERHRAEMAVMAAQRNAKIAGIFARLYKRDGKPRYLDYLPRVWGYLNRDLEHPALAPLKAWYDRAIPVEARGRPRAGANA